MQDALCERKAIIGLCICQVRTALCSESFYCVGEIQAQSLVLDPLAKFPNNMLFTYDPVSRYSVRGTLLDERSSFPSSEPEMYKPTRKWDRSVT